LRAAGFGVEVPKATFYVWARVPDGYDSMTVCGKLLDEADVVGIPGAGFGRGGEGYVRFALCVPVERIRVAVERLRRINW
jgi:LL-diaminopimelate aminotransferase